MSDPQAPIVTIYPQVLTITSHDGFPNVLMDDPVYTMDDSRVLFGGTTTAIENMRISTRTNAPKIDIQRQR